MRKLRRGSKNGDPSLKCSFSCSRRAKSGAHGFPSYPVNIIHPFFGADTAHTEFFLGRGDMVAKPCRFDDRLARKVLRMSNAMYVMPISHKTLHADRRIMHYVRSCVMGSSCPIN
jgi:hypothetical protein